MSTTTTNDPNSFLMGGGGKSAKFAAHGDRYTGTIVEMAVTQQTTLDGAPKFWDDGKAMEQLVVTIQTELTDDADDDGMRRLYLKGSKTSTTTSVGAVRDAVKKAGATTLEVGGTLAIAYTGDGEPSRPGLTAPKQYVAKYTAPTAGVDVADIFS